MVWNAAAQRYAWLEHEEGTWHFLTNLFAHPNESTRRWHDRFQAIEELREEGWRIIAPYPHSHKSTRGYGLRQSVH